MMNDELLFGGELSAEDRVYLHDLTRCSISRLEKEPRILGQHAVRLSADMENLAVTHYRTFISSSRCVSDAMQSIAHMDETLSDFLEQIPGLTQQCRQFSGMARKLRTVQRVNRIMIENEAQLIEFLEMPQLMVTCVRNGMYEEALVLEMYGQELLRKHPRIPAVRAVVDEMARIISTIQRQLLEQLQGRLLLPECLRVTGYLRQLRIYSEEELRLQFLQCRGVWLDSIIRKVSMDNAPHVYLKELIKITRVEMLDLITQYRAIFVDDSSQSEDSGASDSGLLHGWVNRRVASLLDAVKRLIPLIREGSYLTNVLDDCMHCGVCLRRVGVDFRMLVVPLFERHIMRLVHSRLSPAVGEFRHSLTQYAWHMDRQSLVRKGVLSDTVGTEGDGGVSSMRGLTMVDCETDTRTKLLEFPPLAILGNVFVDTMNELRHCALLSIQEDVVRKVHHVVSEAIGQLTIVRNLRSAADEDAVVAHDCDEKVDWRDGHAPSLTNPRRSGGDCDDADKLLREAAMSGEDLTEICSAVAQHLIPFTKHLLEIVYGKRCLQYFDSDSLLHRLGILYVDVTDDACGGDEEKDDEDKDGGDEEKDDEDKDGGDEEKDDEDKDGGDDKAAEEDKA